LKYTDIFFLSDIQMRIYRS